MSFCVLFFLLLDCRCFPAGFHLGFHPALGLSLKRVAFLSPDYLLCIENRCQLTRRACERNSDSPASGGVVRHRKQSDATLGARGCGVACGCVG